MSAKNRSIRQRLARAGSPEVQLETALDWAAAWHREQSNLVRMLGKAIKDDNYDQLCIVTGQLKAVTIKKFAALPNVISKLNGGPR